MSLSMMIKKTIKNNEKNNNKTKYNYFFDEYLR